MRLSALILVWWCLAGSAVTPASPRPVIVELFTSEGCSSCPPADAALLEWTEKQPFPGVEIISLAQHVDYWNSIGWVDPYSSPDRSLRQSLYADRDADERVYTPQMIVAGGTPFVGADPAAARREIENALALPSGELAWREGRVVVEALPEGLDTADVFVAVIESGLVTESIPRGENRGRTLAHPSVVRRLVHVGHVKRSELPRSFKAKTKGVGARNAANLRNVAFLQERGLGRIRGAALD